MSDAVNHPSHYAEGWSNGAEVIDITENLNFNRGNAVKYVARAGKKDKAKELEDLQKAKFYLDREIERIARWDNPPSYKVTQDFWDDIDQGIADSGAREWCPVCNDEWCDRNYEKRTPRVWDEILEVEERVEFTSADGERWMWVEDELLSTSVGLDFGAVWAAPWSEITGPFTEVL